MTTSHVTCRIMDNRMSVTCLQAIDDRVTSLPWLANRPVEPLPPVTNHSEFSSSIADICSLITRNCTFDSG